MSTNDENWRKVRAMSRAALEKTVVDIWNRADDRRFRKEATDDDLLEASAELSGVELARLFDMKTLLDSRIRIETDDGGIDWKTRDEGTPKEHTAFGERQEALHERSAGIRRRKLEKFAAWLDEQGSELDHAAPIGDYLWRDTQCAICGKGYRADDPFELAHNVAVALGGGDGSIDWAHRSCNRAEGIG